MTPGPGAGRASRRGRGLRLGGAVLRLAGAALGLVIVFVLAIALAVVLHLDIPPLRRVAAARVQSILASGKARSNWSANCSRTSGSQLTRLPLGNPLRDKCHFFPRTFQGV